MMVSLLSKTIWGQESVWDHEVNLKINESSLAWKTSCGERQGIASVSYWPSCRIINFLSLDLHHFPGNCMLIVTMQIQKSSKEPGRLWTFIQIMICIKSVWTKSSRKSSYWMIFL